MKNFREIHDATLAKLTGRKAEAAPEFKITEVDIPLELENLTPNQLALRRIGNLGVCLGTARNTLVTQTPLEGVAATHLLNSIPHELRAELKITPNITEKGEVVFVMKAPAYVTALMREFYGELPKPEATGHGR